MSQAATYEDLVRLATEFRAAVKPATAKCVPDYSAAAMSQKSTELANFRTRLAAMTTDQWSESQRIDFDIVKAEMNGVDFDLRVMRPWARDPTFYATIFQDQSDVPEHEGPSAEPAIDLYEFKYPLSKDDQRQLTCLIGAVPALLEHAKVNLKDSTARDLWVYGTRAFREQSKILADLEAGTLSLRTLEGSIAASLRGADRSLIDAVRNARESTDSFRAWLEAQAPAKQSPSGIGKDNYDWYMKHVHLVPYTWEQQVTLLRRELERARASLALEEARNRKLPPLEPVSSEAAFSAMADAKLKKIIGLLIDSGIVEDQPYYRDAMLQQKGSYQGPEVNNFFANTTARDPLGIYSHNYHWIELAHLKHQPHASPIRRLVPLHDMYDSRSEGIATAMEEILMHAGMYDDHPRGREIVWIMLANRAARGLASLYVQANEMTAAQAGEFHGRWTPRKWADPASDLVVFEQLLYLRQPGYGTSYITGKLLLDRLMSDYAFRRESENKPFDLRAFFRELNAAGIVPFPLIEREMIGSPAHMGTPVVGEGDR